MQISKKRPTLPIDELSGNDLEYIGESIDWFSSFTTSPFCHPQQGLIS